MTKQRRGIRGLRVGAPVAALGAPEQEEEERVEEDERKKEEKK